MGIHILFFLDIKPGVSYVIIGISKLQKVIFI